MRIDRIETTARPPASAGAAAPASQQAPAQPPANGGSAQQEFLSAAQQLREAIGQVGPTLPRFNVNPIDNRVQVEIVDETTGEIVREFPQEALINFARSWDRYLGTLVDREI